MHRVFVIRWKEPERLMATDTGLTQARSPCEAPIGSQKR